MDQKEILKRNAILLADEHRKHCEGETLRNFPTHARHTTFSRGN